jgi:hypothetical protein
MREEAFARNGAASAIFPRDQQKSTQFSSPCTTVWMPEQRIERGHLLREEPLHDCVDAHYGIGAKTERRWRPM